MEDMGNYGYTLFRTIPFGVSPTVGKSQIYFLAFAQPWASHKFIF